MSEKKMVRRSVAIGLGIVCIILIAGLGGAMAYYTLTINNKNTTINQLNATIADQLKTIASLNVNITNLETWLSGNITAYNNYVNSHHHTDEDYQNLQNQITQLQTWLNGNVTAYNNEVTLYNNYVLDHHHTDEDYANYYNIANLANSTIVKNDVTVSQGNGAYSDFSLSANYAGYVSVYVQTSTVAGTHVQLNYSAYGVNYNQEITVSAGSSAVFPVLPSSITIGVGNGLVVGSGATETVTITYYY